MEVNQRALIDKVLARYSGEFTGAFHSITRLGVYIYISVYTVFRELLQNSDDAASRKVEIRFETEAYLARQGAKDENKPTGEVNGKLKLPDLKTALVRDSPT